MGDIAWRKAGRLYPEGCEREQQMVESAGAGRQRRPEGDVPRAPELHILRASLTVEAAMLMPILFSALFLILYLGIHVHNRCCLCASAAEQAVSGHEQENPSCLGLSELTCSRSDSDGERKVSYQAGSLFINGETLWSIREEAVYEKCRPVEAIRKVAAAKRLIGDKKQ